MPGLRLEVFDGGTAPARTTVVTDMSALEEGRLAAYEQGYAAGWDDATAMHARDQARLGAEIANNLQSLAFTYHEARAHVLRGIEPLLTLMTDRILPATVAAALGPVILETLRPLIATMSGPPVTLLLNPAARATVEAQLAAVPGLPVILSEEPTLGEGQAWLRLGDTETRIDLDGALARITAAVHAFLELTLQETRDG